jgi:hypothetical protein
MRNVYKSKRRKPQPPRGVTAEFQEQAGLARDELRARALGEQPTAPSDLALAEFAHIAFELRRRGASYGAIAKHISTVMIEKGQPSVTRAFVVDLVGSYINALDAETREPVKFVKRLELERIDAILWGTSGTDGVFERARKGDDRAIDRFLALQERRLALMGIPLNKLVIEGKVAHTVEDPVALLFAKLKKRIESSKVKDVNQPPALNEPAPAPQVVDDDSDDDDPAE